MDHIPEIDPGTVVVGYDASQSARQAALWAVEVARAERAPLALVYATGTVAFGLPDVPVPMDEMMRLAVKEGDEQVAEMVAELRDLAPGIEVSAVVVLDDARTALLSASKQARLLVLGSRGRGPLQTLLLGSVGVAAVRHAHCPVVVHRPQHPGESPRGVVVGADGSAASRPVLERAYAEAERRGLPLTVLHSSWDLVATWGAAYVEEAAATDVETEKRALAESMAGLREDHPDVVADVVLASGPPVMALSRLSREAELLVLGHEQQGLAERLLVGSVALQVVERAACPVLVVPLS